MILLKNGIIINPADETEKTADMLIVGDRIALIKEEITAMDIGEAEDGTKLNIVDCTGKIVGPGLVDIHVHFRDPGFEYKEDIESGAKAAAAGGYTSVILMANTKPAVDNVDTLRYVLEKGGKTDINVYTCANVTKGLKGSELTDFAALKAAGAIGFTDDGIPLMDERIAEQAMELAVSCDSVLSFHEENPEYITNNGVNRGKASEYYSIGGSDRLAEISMVERDIKLAEKTGAKINIQHISTKEAVELVRQSKKRGCKNIYAEATPHHIALTEEATIEKGTLAKMNPPLREEADRLAIIDAIEDGTIDFIATDHAPHASYEKDKPITDAPSGIIGLETALPIVYEKLVKDKNMSFLKVFCKMSLNPARLYNISAGKLAKNEIADVVIFDENCVKKYEKTYSKSENSPYFQHIFKGNVAMTICRGKVVYQLKE